MRSHGLGIQFEAKENRINTEFEALSDSIKMRCPSCFQLYNVSPWEIKSTRPKFDCQKCESQFWISFPECLETAEVLGFPIEWLYPDQNPASQKKNDLPGEMSSSLNKEPQTTVKSNLESCIVCAHENPKESQECAACGVVFEKLMGVQDGAPRSSYSLRKYWADVMEDFVEDGAHSKFLKACKKEDNLEFAAYKYKILLECCPGEQKVQDMLRVVEELTKFQTVSQKSEKAKKNKNSVFSIWSFSYVICTAIISFGLLVPDYKNIIGIGVALLFLVLSIKHYLNKPNTESPFL